MLRTFVICALFPVLLSPQISLAQGNLPNTIEALKIESDLKLDGYFREPAWDQVKPVSNFIQRVLDEGEPVTEKSQVAIFIAVGALK